jgi:hypothetical protein
MKIIFHDKFYESDYADNNASYHWMIIHQPAFVSLSDELVGKG